MIFSTCRSKDAIGRLIKKTIFTFCGEIPNKGWHQKTITWYKYEHCTADEPYGNMGKEIK